MAHPVSKQSSLNHLDLSNGNCVWRTIYKTNGRFQFYSYWPMEKHYWEIELMTLRKIEFKHV